MYEGISDALCAAMCDSGFEAVWEAVDAAVCIAACIAVCTAVYEDLVLVDRGHKTSLRPDLAKQVVSTMSQ